MTVRPKLSGIAKTITERRRRFDGRQYELPLPEELRREICDDDEGNAYTVIAWRPYPGLALTEYTLDNGSPVKHVDDSFFEIVSTKQLINRRG